MYPPMISGTLRKLPSGKQAVCHCRSAHLPPMRSLSGGSSADAQVAEDALFEAPVVASGSSEIRLVSEPESSADKATANIAR
jgi:hypothetical protein